MGIVVGGFESKTGGGAVFPDFKFLLITFHVCSLSVAWQWSITEEVFTQSEHGEGLSQT